MTVQFWSAMSVVVIIVPAAVLMLWGWRRRVRRQQQAIAPLAPVPGGLAQGAARHAKYVATTTGGDRYDRIAAHGLAFRGSATVSAGADGVLVERDGEADIWIAAERIVGIDRATWAIDRVVEGDGLHLVRWRHGDRELDTYLRLDEPGLLDDDLRAAGLPLRRLEFPPTRAEERRAAKRARQEARHA